MHGHELSGVHGVAAGVPGGLGGGVQVLFSWEDSEEFNVG